MKANVGGLDRSLRIIAGLFLVDLALSGTAGAWAWVGLLPLFSGALAWCPLYLPSGLSTVTRVVHHLSTEALRDAIFVHAQSTVRPRTVPARSSSSA